MPITAQQKLEILQQVGADPDKYWLDDDGNVIEMPKDTSAMAGVKTALLNLPRTAAGIGGAALGTAGAGMLGAPSGPGAVATGIAGGFAGAAAGSTLGEKLQQALYPADVLLAQEARQVRNPVATQVGDLAAQAAFMRPSLSQTRDAIRGVRALTTLPKFANMRPAQSGALMNMAMGGTIEGASTLVQGGDAGEIAKNAAIGAVFSNPTWLAGKMTRGVFSPHVPDMGLRDVVNPAELRVQPGEPAVEKPAEVNPELLKAFAKQQKVDAKLAEQLAALKANQEAAAKRAQIEAEQGIGNEQPLPAQDFVLPPNLDTLESRFLRSQAVEPDVEVTLDPQPPKPQPKPPVIAEPGTPGALDQELGIRMTKPFFDWWQNNAGENYRTRMNLGRPTGDQGQSVAGVTEGTRGADGKRNITVDEQAYTDTAPHELTHGMILDVLQHGKKGEKAEMRRLLKLAGVDEEAFVQGVGEDVVRRFMDKTDDSWRSDFVSFMKYKFGKATPEDARRIMSNTMLRGGGPKTLPKVAVKPTQQKEEERVIPSTEGQPPVMPETRPERMLPYIEEGKVTPEARQVANTTEVRLNEADPALPSNERRALPATPERQQLTFEPLGDVRGTLEQGAEPTNIEGVRESGELTPEERYAAEDAKIRRLEEEAAALRRRRDFPRALRQAEGNPAPERGERLPGSERRGREREVNKALRSADLENADLSNVGREEVRESTKAELTNKMKQGRVVSENVRESAADLEARRIEAKLAGEERPRYQEFGEDRPYGFWVDREGNMIPVRERWGHEDEARRILKEHGVISADLLDIDVVQNEMQKLGYLHGTNTGGNEYVFDGQRELTETQKKAVKRFGEAGKNVIYHSLSSSRRPNLLYSPNEDGPRYQEFGEDRTFATDFEKELIKSAPFKIQASKDGRLNRNDIKAAVAKLNPTEQEMLKEAGLEQYLTKVARPTKEELQVWADENLPRVEVRELSAEGPFSSEAEKEMAVLAHELDTLKPGWADLIDTNGLPEHIATKIERYEDLKKIMRADAAVYSNDSATRRYDDAGINPRPLAAMPGAVDLLVRLPRRKRDMNDSRNWDSPNPSEEEAPLYFSNHYPQSGDNLLAHVRAYEHTMPDGERVLRVFELQSDWAQDRRKELGRIASDWTVRKSANDDGTWEVVANNQRRTRGAENRSFSSKEEAEQYKASLVSVSDHPLLPHHQRLALKAAIEHARKRGIKRVVIDDAETAMMTEGHDKLLGIAKKLDGMSLAADDASRLLSSIATKQAKKVGEVGELVGSGRYHVDESGHIHVDKFPFEGGMKLSYDNVLQQMMRDLSGDGVKVEMGEHRNAMAQHTNEYVGMEGERARMAGKPFPRADLIFRNPDGTPKTQSTGFAYDVSAAQARRDAGEPFSYAGRRYQGKHDAQVETPEFKNWFGDSVVRDETGKPKMVYHGSRSPGFNEFKTNASGYTYGNGAYFTPEPRRAGEYAGARVRVVDYDKDGNSIYGYPEGEAGGTYGVYLSLKKPFVTSSDAGVADLSNKLRNTNPKLYNEIREEIADKNNYSSPEAVGTVEIGNLYLRKQGYDGVIKEWRKGDPLEYVVFEPTQIKSATGNRGTFDSKNPDIRYQQFGPNRPASGLADPAGRRDMSPFESASQKAARSDNPVIRTVGRALTELFPAQRAMRGKYRALPEAFANLNEKDKDLLYKILIDEYRAGKPAPGTVPARLRKEYNDVRRTLRQMRDDQIKAGQRNADGAIPGIDDSYFPNVVDPSVRKTIVDEIDSPRFKQLRKEFVDFNEAHLRSKGYTNIKAAEEANKFFNRFIGTLNKQPVEGAFDFGAVVLPEGSRLPDNWLHSDPAEAMSQYVRDWSRSRTFHDIVQTNEDVMAGLGQEEFFVNGKKTPVKNRVTPVVKDSNILHLLNESLGIRRGSQDKITGAIGRAASAAWLANPITRSVDIATSLFKGLGMVTPSQIPGLVSNLRNLGKSYERAHDTGWIREDGNTIVGEVLGAGEAFSHGVDKFSKGLSKYTGSEKLENFGRGLSQNIGEYIARTNTALAQSGNKRAADFLDRVSPNWRTLSEAELGTRIGQLFQGRYDATNLPQWLSDSPAAPFFSLARWNIEQWNNFREFAIKPARNGDPVPLITMLVAGIAGGVGVKEVREALSGRKSKIATLKEIAEAPEGSAKYKEAVRYLGNLAQLSGTMGIVSEMSNWGLDIASKDMPAAASMPALEVTRDIIPRLIAAGNAMMDGEDPLTVITQVSRDIGNEHVSAYRFIEGNLGRTGVWSEAGEDLADANARRDLRVGKRLRDEPIKAAVQLPIDYSRAEERAVEKERDPVKMRQMARELKADIKADPDKDNRERRMRSAAASRPSYMPSKENDPKAFREQLDFVRRTQGPEKAEDLRLRYLRDKKNADARRKMFN